MRAPNLKLLLFATVAVVSFFALLEGVLRLVDYPPGVPYREAPGVKWRLQPGLRASPMVHHESGHTFHVSTDANGLRITPSSRPLPSGCRPYRILILGDSNTFGWGLEDDQTWGASLQRALASRGVRVINGGMPGYTLAQCYELYRRVGRRYHPDMVILSVGMHDMAPRPAPPPAEGARRVALDTRRTLLSHSRLVRLLRMVIMAPHLEHAVHAPKATPAEDAGKEPPRVTAAEFERLLNAFSDDARREGFLLVTAPIPGINTSRYLPIMARLGRQGRLLHITLAPDPPYERLPQDHEHLGVRGAERFGQDLARALMPYLPSPCKTR